MINNYYHSRIQFILLYVGIQIFSGCSAVNSQNKPNVIVILVDDLGWKDSGCYGSTFYETPAIDKLAEEGVRFTHAYSAHPVCGPSRASILSGKHPLRLGNTSVLGNLPSSEITLAESMKKGGYTTFFAGKWHVGMSEDRDPLHQGFDYAVGLNPEGQPGSYFYPYKDTGCDWEGVQRKVIPNRDVNGLENGKEGEYLTDRLTNETIHFISNHRKQPFFVYLSHYAVHTPLQAKDEYIAYFEEKNRLIGSQNHAELKKIKERAYLRINRSNPVFAAMIKSLDESVGKLTEKLEAFDLSENTIIVFTSDNGGLSSFKTENPQIPTSNLPLKYGKGWNYDGGIRVPAIIKWPGNITPKSTLSTPICLYDLYPTILDMVGLPLNAEQHVDGISLLSVINGEKQKKRKFNWYYPHKHASGHFPSAAIQDGDFKLIWHINDDIVELYNLKDDISENTDLTLQYPDKSKELKEELILWIENTKPTTKY